MNVDDTLRGWIVGVRILQLAHYKAAAYYSSLHRVLGLTVVIFSTVSGTAVFSTLRNVSASEASMWTKVVVGAISITTAVLAAIQTFVGAPERSERHKVAGVRYGELRHELDVARIRPVSVEEAVLFMEKFRPKWDAVDREAPPLPQRFHDISLAYVRDSMSHARELGFETPLSQRSEQRPGSEGPTTAPNSGPQADG